MVSKIENKINDFIDSILQKNVIDHMDYQVLANEVMRLRLIQEKEEEEKRSKESAERMKKISEMMVNGGPYLPV